MIDSITSRMSMTLVEWLSVFVKLPQSACSGTLDQLPPLVAPNHRRLLMVRERRRKASEVPSHAGGLSVFGPSIRCQ